MPKFIDGIFNYCDRWCERCPLTARCRVYAMEQQDNGDPAARDINNAAFWKKLEAQFAQAFQMLKTMAAERGIDLDDPKLRARAWKMRSTTRNKRLIADTTKYAKDVGAWFKRHEATFEQKSAGLEVRARLVLPGKNPVVAALEIRDAVDVLHWYQFQIAVKLTRASTRDGLDAELEKRDGSGSAKVALIGMDRSITAWAALSKHFAEHANEILAFLLALERLRQTTEKMFPQAREFYRPGLDGALAPTSISSVRRRS